MAFSPILGRNGLKRAENAVSSGLGLAGFRGIQPKSFFDRGHLLRNTKEAPVHGKQRAAELFDTFFICRAPFQIEFCHMNFMKSSIK